MQQLAGAPAIDARDLVKTYPGGVRALDGLSHHRGAGDRLRPARAERRGEVHDRQDPHHPVAPRLGHGRDVAGIDVLREPDRVRRVIGTVSQKPAIDVEATGRENMVLQGRVYGMSGRELSRPDR